MHHFSEFIACLVILVVAEGARQEIRLTSGEDAVLSCEAKSKPDVAYRWVTWYKVSEDPSQKLTGLVRKKLPENNSTVEKYKGAEREVKLLESSMSLLLSNVTEEDNNATTEKLKFNESDTIYIIVAITVLIMALLMFFMSYVKSCLPQVCLRNVFQTNKKLLKDSLLKMQHQGKNVIITNHLICKTTPEVYCLKVDIRASVMRLSTSISGLNIICFIKPEEAQLCVRSSLGVIPGYC
ncbi:Myelin-oligodendrocyte glycoprotein [Labeo rohita]|uniref:Myelin-oligodendrocyte glycoprotein n=1 Tax=Labeo rohita TaxID=84645 RepID=A0ABQ8LWL6_LABRO|nr:Myelin-oligodendrocyte glycoprotein [Labeo rohita]